MTTRTVIIAGLVCFVLVPTAQAQAPQSAGGPVPPRAIVRIVHANGLDPVGRPVREGPAYIVRAIDRRGLLMRVVVDARSGQIRAVNRIVPGPGSPGRVAMRPLPPYGPPPEFDPPPVAPDEYSDLPPARPMRPPVARPIPRVSASATPPLPRPRPGNVVADAPPPPAETKPAAPAAVPAGNAKAPPSADAPPINE